MIAFRCHKCDKLLARITADSRVEIVCPRCKAKNDSEKCIEHNGRLVRRDLSVYVNPLDAREIKVMTEEEYLEQFKNL